MSAIEVIVLVLLTAIAWYVMERFLPDADVDDDR